MKDDLWIWKKTTAAARLGLPLRETFENPPIDVITFVSDAAGASLEWKAGICKNTSIAGDRGVAAIGYKGDQVNWIGTITWPTHLLIGQKSREGKYFGTKSTTLETVGLLLPFLARPKEMMGHHILLQVDNTAVVHAWRKKYLSSDPETSLLIRCLHVIEAFLECKIYVRHLRRMSNPIASLADALSRKATTTQTVLAQLRDVQWDHPRGPLLDWLNEPLLDWELPRKIVSYLTKTM